MKRSILLLLVMAAAVAGCVHPTDLDSIAPAAPAAKTASTAA